MIDILLRLSEKELESALSLVPKDKLQRMALFTEIIRVFDYFFTIRTFNNIYKEKDSPNFDIMMQGHNLVYEHIYTDIKERGFPLMESDSDTINLAKGFIHKFGRSVLLKRTYDMAKSGFVLCDLIDNKIIIKMADHSKTQFNDNMEFYFLDDIKSAISEGVRASINGWNIIETTEYTGRFSLPGSYMITISDDEVKKYRLDNVLELMESHVFPWDSGKGVMTGYHSTKEVEDHFFSIAVEKVRDWSDEYGIHPSVKINGVEGTNIILVVSLIVSLHLKHINYVFLATKKYKSISFQQSLTIWKPIDEIIDHLIEYSGFDRDFAEKILKMLMIENSDIKNLSGHTTPVLPLLIDLGNGNVLMPVNSIYRNPFISIISILGWRFKNLTNIISKPREDWLRLSIYGQFQGNKYRTVDGNIKLRSNNIEITDIDGAIYDRITGDLAIIQIKWQDYYLNDVRKLRSRAKNFIEETNKWANAVEDWIEKEGVSSLVKSLRLKLKKGKGIKNIYMFSISKTSARMAGFGYELENSKVAIANWPMFFRTRFEVGASDEVFKDIFNRLKEEEAIAYQVNHIPYSFDSIGYKVEYKDMWTSFD